MKIIPRDNVPKYFLPLPIYKSVHIADAIDKLGEEFDVFAGLSKKYVEQLKQHSLNQEDTELMQNTGDYKRFGLGSYEKWYAKKRTPFALVNKRQDSLAAIIWFGPKPLGKKSIKHSGSDENPYESEWHTVSFRSYPKFRGRGIMRNFSQYVIEVYKSFFTLAKLWVGTDDRNKVAIKLFTELGFDHDYANSDPETNWLVMTKE